MGLTGRRVAGATAAIAMALPLLAACTSTGKPGSVGTDACLDASSTPTVKVALNSIHANIWNAGGKAGQAANVASQLTWRGIKVIDTGNDPAAGAPPKHAEIRYGPNGKQIALTLAQQVKDATLEQDDRTNPSVDLVIGSKFALTPVPPPPATKVTLNIFNAFVIPGTASDLAATMRKRGFTTDKVGNTSDFYGKESVVIRYGLRGEPAARRAALQFKKPTMEQDNRKSTTVDVVIGSKWKDSAVVPAAQATVPPTPSPTSSACRPTSSTSGGSATSK